MNKNILYILISIFISNCSFSKKRLRWKWKIIDIFKKVEPIQKEFNSIKNKKLKTFKYQPFLRNYSNNNGNINFDTNFENISTFKFSKIKKFNSNQPELFFTENNEIIFFNGKGNIFKINQQLRKIWEINNYNRKEKKLNPILYFAQIDNKLIVNDNLSKVYAIDLDNGKVLWSRYGSSSFNSDIKIFQDIFLTIDFDNVIRAISSKDGKELEF